MPRQQTGNHPSASGAAGHGSARLPPRDFLFRSTFSRANYMETSYSRKRCAGGRANPYRRSKVVNLTLAAMPTSASPYLAPPRFDAPSSYKSTEVTKVFTVPARGKTHRARTQNVRSSLRKPRWLFLVQHACVSHGEETGGTFVTSVPLYWSEGLNDVLRVGVVGSISLC